MFTLQVATKYELQMSSKEIFFNNGKTSFKPHLLEGNGFIYYNCTFFSSWRSVFI